MKTIPLFDALIRETDVRNDAGIGRLTRTQNATISRIRQGKENISEGMRFRTALGTGWSAQRIEDLVRAGGQETV